MKKYEDNKSSDLRSSSHAYGQKQNDTAPRKRFLEKYDYLKIEWLHDFRVFIIIAIVLFVIFRFFLGFSVISGDSMEPNLSNGQIVLYTRIPQSLEQGDIVSVRIPSGEYYVKRIVAMDDDVVELYDGDVYINGDIYDDPYAMGATEEDNGVIIYPYEVGEGNMFLLGDNREVSKDSRSFGAVNKRQIKGKLLLMYQRGEGFKWLSQ